LKRFRAFQIINSDVINPRTYGMTPHLRRIKRPQHLGRRSNISKSWIKPQIVVPRRKNDWHSVVNIREELVRQGFFSQGNRV
jgi:hypothetical protein